MPEVSKSSATHTRAHPPARGAVRPRVDLHDLLGTNREITIEHAGADYTLRITRNGKLILTK